MKILHIANDFSETKVHANLYKELDKLGVDQTVFNPIRIKNKQSIGKNEWKAEHTRFVYAPVVKPFHRYVYHIKRRRVFRELLRSVDVKQFNLVHATTLLTDGGQAYLLYKKFHLPYVVSVRNTDINGFLDKLLHTWKDARKILLNAEKIFFISEGLKKKFYNHRAVRNIIPKIKDKFVLLPNGIEDYFVDNIKTDQRQGHGIIYIGNFTNNKNVCRLARSVIRLQQDPSFLDVRLTIIGGGQQTNNEIDEIIANNKTTINYLGRINDKQRLSEILCENSIFAMPSIHETFGLVYLEALSQNLAVVYTKGQGIDGLFDQSVGIGVNPFSEQDIYSALKKILTNRDKYNNKGVDFSQFRWQTIARKYLEHYRQVLGCADIDKSLLVSFKKILRGGKYKLKFLLRHNKIGFSSQIESRTFLKGCNIGKYVYIGSDCVINYATIGNYTCIASTVKIGGMEHSYRYPSISPRLSDECVFGKITTIGNDVWIGANVVVRQGVTIGNGAVIGAGSIVTHDVLPYTISYGSPAVVRKKRFEDEELEKKIKESHYWEKSPKEARHIIIRLLNS